MIIFGLSDFEWNPSPSPSQREGNQLPSSLREVRWGGKYRANSQRTIIFLPIPQRQGAEVQWGVMRLSIAVSILLLWLLCSSCQKSDQQPPLPPSSVPREETVRLQESATPLPTKALPTPKINTVTIAPTPSPTVVREVVLGEEVRAKRQGEGALEIVLVGAKWGKRVPTELSIWELPTLPSLSADSWLDTCPDNDPEERQLPFHDPLSAELRDFTKQAQLVIFYEQGETSIITDTCGFSQEIAELKQTELADHLQALENRPEQFIDYLVSIGIPALIVRAPSPQKAQALIEPIVGHFQKKWVEQAWIDQKGSRWQFSADTLIHPLAILPWQGLWYLLDSGRILAIDPNYPNSTFVTILEPGETVEGVRVLEPLDMTAGADGLYVLDRAGDVYRWQNGAWTLARYDRPIDDRSSHYYAAIAQSERQFLLEISAPLLLRAFKGQEKSTLLPQAFYPIDVSAQGDTAHLLYQDKTTGQGWWQSDTLGALSEPQPLAVFAPRQIEAVGDSLFILDQDGRRVQAFSADNQLLQTYRLTKGQPISSFWSDGRLTAFASRDAIYFHCSADCPPSRQLETNYLRINSRPHDRLVLDALPRLRTPIGIPHFNQPDIQMAGAPRHYRLGVHEGFDFYWQRGTQIAAVGAGNVARADWDYVEPWPELFTLFRGQSAELGYTSPEAEEFFRGRQLWINHTHQLLTRYAHLSSLDELMIDGASVEQGQIVARVGNSGSPGLLVSPDEDAHLHLELRVDDGYLGQFIRPIEARTWLSQLLR